MDPFKRPLPPPDELDPALFSITREERQYMQDAGIVSGRASGVETRDRVPLPVSGSESSPPLAGPDREAA